MVPIVGVWGVDAVYSLSLLFHPSPGPLRITDPDQPPTFFCFFPTQAKTMQAVWQYMLVERMEPPIQTSGGLFLPSNEQVRPSLPDKMATYFHRVEDLWMGRRLTPIGCYGGVSQASHRLIDRLVAFFFSKKCHAGPPLRGACGELRGRHRGRERHAGAPPGACWLACGLACLYTTLQEMI